MAKKDKTGLELLRELVAGLKLEGEAAKEAGEALTAVATELEEALNGKKTAEGKASEAEKMLKEAAEQLENTVSTKKGVQKTKVKVAGEEYMVNPLRKITGVPGHGDKVFTGKDVITNAVKVAHEGKDIGLKEYLAATGASILEPSNGRK